MEDSNREDETEDRSDNKSMILEIVSILLLVGFAYFVIEGSLVLGFKTTTPVTVVSSTSMDTPDSQEWQDDYEIRGFDPETFPFQEGLQVGDLVFVRGVNSVDELEVGDVIVYWQGDVGDSRRIIHRVYKKHESGSYVTTQGDSNKGPGEYEIQIGADRIVGKAVGTVPYLGYPALGVRT